MEIRLQKELEALKNNLFKMATLVEESIGDSVQSVVSGDPEFAKKIFEKRGEINSTQIITDSVCLKLLAFGRPIASEFRFVSTALKVNTDLGQMGEKAVKIAERALSLNEECQMRSYVDISQMAEIAQSMVKDALDAFVDRDPNFARSVLERDDLIDKLNDRVIRELLTYLMDDPMRIPRVIDLMTVCRCLERIGDHATSIAQDVIFMVNALPAKQPCQWCNNRKLKPET